MDKKPHQSLDGNLRKRFYLFRHGEVDYTGTGGVVKDPDLVNLTENGQKQAVIIDENTKDFLIERIISSLQQTKSMLDPFIKSNWVIKSMIENDFYDPFQMRMEYKID